MTPDIYAMSWFITVFARKNPISLVLCLWDLMLQLEDPIYIVFIAVAFIHSHREVLFEAAELLPQKLVALTLTSAQSVVECVRLAAELKRLTPYTIICETRKMGFNVHLNEYEREFGMRDLMVCLTPH